MKIHIDNGIAAGNSGGYYMKEVRCLPMKKDWQYHQGDVYLADLGEATGSEQGGIRPVVVIQNEVGCRRSTTMTIVPLTSNIKKMELPTHYILRFAAFLLETSMAMGEQARAIDKVRIQTYLGKLDHRDLRAVERAVMVNIRTEQRKKRRRLYEAGNTDLGKE